MNLADFKYIDSHCHVEDKSLNKYREDIVNRAFEKSADGNKRYKFRQL